MIYGGIIGVWVLSYMDKVSADRFLAWAFKHCELMLLVEPLYMENQRFEKYIDVKQQMIARHESTYR